MALTKTPLSSRPLDFIYFAFFAIHIPATLLIDLQAIYPVALVPDALAALPSFYVQMTNDPLIGSAMGYFGDNAHMLWFKTFLFLELMFQLPVFVIGMHGLWADSRSIYVLLLIYGASTATTTLPCLSLLLATPLTSPETIAKGIISVSPEQKLMLLASYLPFFLVPFGMALDMTARVTTLVRKVSMVEEARKLK